jgi:osmotically-inducible protein OsmY
MKRISRVALVTLCVCGAVACETGPRKSEADKQADRAMAERVELALNSDTDLYARHIVVRANNGVVRLTGFVWEQPDLSEAVRVASAVQGVSRVENDLELQRNGLGDSPVSR